MATAKNADAVARIAIVGGGISGLALSQALRRINEDNASSSSFHVTLFDTGERACGGRMSSKALDGEDVDHAVQYFTSTEPEFQERFVQGLAASGALAEWHDSKVGVLTTAKEGGGTFKAFGDGLKRYVGVGGYRAIADVLSTNADVVCRPQWVGSMRRRGDDAKWELASSDNERAKKLGTYDFVVIAHNGKCAHRLASTAKDDGAGKLISSLTCAFGIRPSQEIEQQRKLLLSSVWSVMIVLEGAHDFGFEGAHVVGGDTLSWVSNITAKRGDANVTKVTKLVLQSTAEYARDNKVPQEAVPKAKAQEVMETLVTAFERSIGCEPNTYLGKVANYECQLWGAANPLNVANVPCVLDLKSRTAAVGDWCTSDAPCVQTAVMSAYALADALNDFYNSPQVSAKTLKLDAARVRWSLPRGASSAQGCFPGTSVPAMREALPMPVRTGGRGGGRGRGGRGRGGRNAKQPKAPATRALLAM